MVRIDAKGTIQNGALEEPKKRRDTRTGEPPVELIQACIPRPAGAGLSRKVLLGLSCRDYQARAEVLAAEEPQDSLRLAAP